MSTDQKASLVGTITYSNGANFSGWLLIGIVPPLWGEIPYSKFFKKSAIERVRLPQWVTFPVRDGEISSEAKLRYNSSLEPPNTKYAAFFVDTSNNILDVSTIFTVEATPYTIVEPEFTIPTAGVDAPTPCSIASVTAFSSPVWQVPAGTIDGVNAVFTLTVLPIRGIVLFVNGLSYYEGIGYTRSGKVITFESGYEPPLGADLLAIIF